VSKRAAVESEPDLFLAALPAGAFFGESAILGSGPDGGRRNASISAATQLVPLHGSYSANHSPLQSCTLLPLGCVHALCVLLQVLLRLERETCVELLGSSKEVFEREARRRARETALAEKVLAQSDFYQALSSAEKRSFVHALVERTLEGDEPPLTQCRRISTALSALLSLTTAALCVLQRTSPSWSRASSQTPCIFSRR
jgi:hypothetical protein